MELPFLKMYFMRMSDLPECVGIYYVCACCPWKPEQAMGFCTVGVRKKTWILWERRQCFSHQDIFLALH